jgi:flagellar hook protein FlgE
MGIFGALNTAVAGMRAQSFALENISGNIANSQTIGFKREDTSFVDLIPDASPLKQVAGSVTANSRSTNNVQGDVQTASIGTYMAINGNGYFVVEKPTGFTGSTPTFGGQQLYARRGDFSPDRNGYLVNGAGYYLKGIPLDPTTGNPIGSVPQLLQFTNNLIPAQATTTLTYAANLPSSPKTPNTTSTVGSELLNPATGYGAGNPLSTVSGGGGIVYGSNEAQFLGDSISGGAVTAYDSLGNAVNVQLRWAKASSGPPTDTWNLFYQTDSTAATSATPATAPAWQNANVDYTFDSTTGQMTSTTASVPLTSMTVDGVSLGTVNISSGATGITQFADSSGTVSVGTLSQDGFAAGTLQGISVDDKGEIVGAYSNGRNLALAQVSLASFNGQNSLKRLDGGAYAETGDSGPPNYNASATISASSLEASNADIGDEFTKLIVTQQAYSANTKVISTANQMVQDLLNTLR